MNSSDVEALGAAARNAFILSIGDLLYNAILAIGAIAIARILGSEGYGVYSLALTVPLTLYTFISLGLDTAITRYVKFYLAEKRFDVAIGVVRVSLLLKVLIGIVGSAICFFYARSLSMLILNRPDLDRYVVFTSIAVLLDSLYTFLLSTFIGFEEVWRNTIIKVVYSVSRTAMAIALLLIGLQVMGVIAAYIAGLMLSILIGFTFLASVVRSINRFYEGDIASVKSFTIARELILYSLPLYAASLANSITAAYQNILLAYTLTEAEIGGYRALVTLQTLVLVVLGPITTSLLPMYTRINVEGNMERLAVILAKSNRYIAAIIVPLTLLSMVYSREIVYLFYGAGYLFVSEYLPLIFAPFLLVGLGSITIPQLFNALGRTKLNMYVAIASIAIFIPMSYILTVVIGYRLWGFLIANIVATIITVILYNILLAKSSRCNINIKGAIPIYISSLAALPVLLALLYIPLPRPVTLLRVVAGGTLYTTLYIILSTVLKAINEHDIEFFTKIFTEMPIIGIFIKPLAIAIIRLVKMVNSIIYHSKPINR